MKQKLSYLMFACFLTGCSFLNQEEPLPIFTLKSQCIDTNYLLSDTLEIDMPISEASLDTERIAITPSLYERDYLADGQWPDRLPKIIQEVLLETLSQRWGETFISRAGAGLQVKYVLQTEIQDFSAYNLTTRPEVYLKIAFKIMNLRERKVLAGKVFFVKEPICVVTMKGIVGALNKGFHTVIEQAVPWMEEIFLEESAFNTRNHKLGR